MLWVKGLIKTHPGSSDLLVTCRLALSKTTPTYPGSIVRHAIKSRIKPATAARAAADRIKIPTTPRPVGVGIFLTFIMVLIPFYRVVDSAVEVVGKLLHNEREDANGQHKDQHRRDQPACQLCDSRAHSSSLWDRNAISIIHYGPRECLVATSYQLPAYLLPT